MLVLSRKEGQRIQIGDDLWVIVGKVKGSRVSLGIDAPKDVSIRRGELCRPIESTSPQRDRATSGSEQSERVA